MIAGIDSDADIRVYLDSREVRKLLHEEIEGVLVKIEKPKRQGVIYVCVDDDRQMENGYGIGIDWSNYFGTPDGFVVEVFVGTEFYRELVDHGRVGLRQRMRDGSKIHIYDRSRLDGVDGAAAESLEFCRDNKEKLPED